MSNTCGGCGKLAVMTKEAPGPPRRLLVAIPNWVGDVVLATPVLAALRAHFPQAQIAYLMRPYVAEIVAGCGWHDASHFWLRARGWRTIAATHTLAAELRVAAYDVALLLTNSFRSGVTAWWAGVPRRIGYARDGRTLLLTDRLRPLKQGGRFVPSPVLPYYIRLAEHLGCPVADRRLRLGITDEQEAAGRKLLRHYGLDDGRPYALINPGAAFGAAKCWPPDRFAAVCDRLAAEHNLRCVLVGAPHEAPLMQAIAAQSRGVVCCDNPGTTLGSLKVLARQASLLVCNDTGPRHYGSAFNVPTVTIFGPTHQAWTDTDYADEIKLQVPVDCGPCQLRTCPLDLRCMTRLSVEMVLGAVRTLLTRRPPRANVTT
jgi:heptosyltransferase II